MPAELSMQGKRVWLRPIEVGDAVALSRASHRERETAYTGGRIPLSVLSFERWIEGLGDGEHVFAICRQGEDECIGTVSLRRIDMGNGTAETGIGLLDAADRGQGLGSEAKGVAAVVRIRGAWVARRQLHGRVVQHPLDPGG